MSLNVCELAGLRNVLSSSSYGIAAMSSTDSIMNVRGCGMSVLRRNAANFVLSCRISSAARGLVLTPFKLTDNGKIDYRWAQQLAAASATTDHT